VIFCCQALTNFRDFILGSIEIIGDISLQKSSVKLTIAFLEPEKSSESLHTE
jgi:hypothetical protein